VPPGAVGPLAQSAPGAVGRRPQSAAGLNRSDRQHRARAALAGALEHEAGRDDVLDGETEVQAEETLARLAAALDEAGGEFEVLVVDDCSTDGTLERALGVEHPHLRVLRHGRNRGYDSTSSTRSNICSAL